MTGQHKAFFHLFIREREVLLHLREPAEVRRERIENGRLDPSIPPPPEGQCRDECNGEGPTDHSSSGAGEAVVYGDATTTVPILTDLGPASQFQQLITTGTLNASSDDHYTFSVRTSEITTIRSKAGMSTRFARSIDRIPFQMTKAPRLIANA